MGENPEPPILRTNKSNSFSLSLYIMAPRSHGLYCLSKVSRYCWPVPSAYCLNLWVQCAWAVHSSVFFYYRQYFSPLDSISHYRDAWGNTYFVKTKAKKVLPCVFRLFFTHTVQQLDTYLLHFAADKPAEAIFTLHVSQQLQIQLSFGFSLHAWAMLLHSSQLAWPHFHLSYTSCFYLGSLRHSLHTWLLVIPYMLPA